MLYSASDFLAESNVPRETFTKLQSYTELLERWQKRINLVSGRTLEDVWRRHVLDSWQLVRLIKEPCGTLVDLGSGAGFPGLIIAACSELDVKLVESDSRKAVFLRESARVMGLKIEVLNRRIEEIDNLKPKIITARALAPISKLLELSEKIHTSTTKFIFPKGRDVEEELTKAHQMWNMKVTRVPSISDPEGTILILDEVYRHGRGFSGSGSQRTGR